MSEKSFNNMDRLMKIAFDKDQRKVSAERIMTRGLDRPKIGASDLACASKYVRDVIYGKHDIPLHHYFRMRKGNVAEKIIETNLASLGIEFESQGEYSCEGFFDFIEVHPDILIDLSQDVEGEGREFIEELRKAGYKYALIELKTTNAIPPKPHDYWVRQVSLQVDAISTTLSIEHSEIYASVYAIELNNGLTRQYPIECDEEEIILSKDDAVTAQAVLEDWLQWANKEKDSMELSVNDVNRNIGNLCSVCDWAQECIGKGKEVRLPDETLPTLEVIAKHSEEAKNVKALKEELRDYLVKLGAGRAKTSGFTVSLRGGNKKEEIDPSGYSREEILAIARELPEVLTINKTYANSLIGNIDKELEWIIDGHIKQKTTPLSVIIKREKKRKR